MVKIKKNIPLAPLTTFGTGGLAMFFCEAGSKDEFKEAVLWAKTENLPVFILGGGSNVLFSDGGFKGLVILNNIKGIIADEKEIARITLGSGEEWDGFISFAVGRGLAGVECLSGIPGKVGAALIQNIGAYGQSVDKVLVSVTVLDLATG